MVDIKTKFKNAYESITIDKLGITKQVCDAAFDKAFMQYKDENTIIELCIYLKELYVNPDNGLDKAFLDGVLRKMQLTFTNLDLYNI